MSVCTASPSLTGVLWGSAEIPGPLPYYVTHPPHTETCCGLCSDSRASAVVGYYAVPPPSTAACCGLRSNPSASAVALCRLPLSQRLAVASAAIPGPPRARVPALQRGERDAGPPGGAAAHHRHAHGGGHPLHLLQHRDRLEIRAPRFTWAGPGLDAKPAKPETW